MNSSNEDYGGVEKPSLSEPPHLRNSVPESSLCGYLGKLSSQQKSLSQLLANTAGKGFVKSLIRQRWVVFSEHTCKLFYFKEKGSTECLGEINIAGATFNYDPEDSDGLFTIMSGGEMHYFTAGNDASRQSWLESLQEGKVRFINRCQEGEEGQTRIQWYTSLPSSPPPEVGRFNISNVLHSTSSKVALGRLRGSAKKVSSSGTSNNHAVLFDRHSSPAQLKNKTLSHENLSFDDLQVTLRPKRLSPKPKRPTSIHFLGKHESHNDNKNSNGIGNGGVERLQNTESISSLSHTQTTNAQMKGYHVSVPASPELENKPLFLRSKSTSRSFRSHFSPLRTGFKNSTKQSEADGRSQLAEPEMASPTSSIQTSISPSPSSEAFPGLRQIGADLKASLSKYSLQRNSKRSSAEVSAVDTWTEAEEGGCANCVQLRRALASVEERLDARNEELKAAKEGIELLQQDLALLYRQRQTSSQLDERNCSDEHLLEILREKDRSLVEFEQSDCVQKNEIAELKQKTQRLSEQVDLFTTLVKAKDNAIRSISDELEELKSRCSISSPPLTNKNAHSVQLSSGIHNFLVSSREGKSGVRLEDHLCNTAVCTSNGRCSLNKIIKEETATSTSSDHQSVKENFLPQKHFENLAFEQNSSVSSDSDLRFLCKDQMKVNGSRRRKSTDSASTDSEPYSSCFDLVADISDLSSAKSDLSKTRHVTSSSLASDDSTPCADLHPTLKDSISESVHESLVDGDPGESLLEASHTGTLTYSNEDGSSNTNDASELGRNTHEAHHDKPTSVRQYDFHTRFIEKPLLNPEETASHRPAARNKTDLSDQQVGLFDQLSTDDVMMSSTGTDSLSVILDHSSIWDSADQEVKLERLSKERDRYQESYRAYKAQNSFLHKQILELSQASDLMKEREERLKHECSVWEARFERVRSKYLVLLNDLHSPPSQQHDKDTLARMLSDALSHTPHFGAVSKNGRYYDECGFCITAADEDSLQRCATFLSRQAQTNVGEELHQVKRTTTAWEAALASASGALPSLQVPVLKHLIRERGLPLHFRPRVWRLLVESHVGALRRTFPETYYEDLLARCIIRPSDDTSSEYVDDKTKKQVELDLLRTLPNNRFYENDYADNIIRLRRVLLAFAVHNREVSYCQGLNRLAAIALLFLPEVEAFWCLVCIVERLMPEQYFTPRLLGPQIDQRVLLVLIAEKLPQLHTHLSQHRIDISMITFNWFLCLFVEEVPHALYLHIWDSFLLEGSKVLFRFALAMLKLCEEGIMARTEFMEVSNYLRSVPPSLGNVDKLKQTAFQWVNPLSSRHLRRLRNLLRQEVLSEVAEQDMMRQQYQQKAEANKGPTAAEILEQDSYKTPDDHTPPPPSQQSEEGELEATWDGEKDAAAESDKIALVPRVENFAAENGNEDVAENNLNNVAAENDVGKGTVENSVEEVAVKNNTTENNGEEVTVKNSTTENNGEEVVVKNIVEKVCAENNTAENNGKIVIAEDIVDEVAAEDNEEKVNAENIVTKAAVEKKQRGS